MWYKIHYMIQHLQIFSYLMTVNRLVFILFILSTCNLNLCYHSIPVGLGCRIRQLSFCRGVRPSPDEWPWVWHSTSPVRLQFWNTVSLQLLPGPPRLRLLVPVRVQSMSQINLFNHFLIIIIIRYLKSNSCVQVIYFTLEVLISSSSCRAASTDIPDPLSPLLPIIHRLWQFFRVTSCVLTYLLYMCSS